MKIILTNNGDYFPMGLQAKYLEAKKVPFFVYVYNFREHTFTKNENPDFNELNSEDILALKDLGDTIANNYVSQNIEDFFNPNFLEDDFRFDEVLIKVLESEEENEHDYRMRVVTIPEGERACIVENYIEDEENEEDILFEKDVSWIVG